MRIATSTTIEICNDLHCLTSNNDDKIEKINWVKTNFKSNKGRKSFNNNGVNRSNLQSMRSNNQPYKRFENKKNLSKPFIKTNSFGKNNFNNGSKNMTNKGKIFRLPVLDRPFLVYTDSSSWAIGCYLAQIDPDTNQEDVVSYGSRLLKDAEKYYSVCERELLALNY